MLTDIVTVLWKEWNEYLHARSSMKGTLMQMFFPVLLFGIFFPAQAGDEWVNSPVPILSFAWLPLLFVSAMTADSFAGERERHTFETLLASRLSDNAVFFGKLIAAVSYGLLITGMIIISGIVTVNIIERGQGLMFYPVRGFVAGLLICVIVSFLIAGIGTLISMRSQTVRQAHQTLSFSIVILALGPTILARFIPHDMRNLILSHLDSFGPMKLALVLTLGLLMLTIAIVAYAAGRCSRTRLNFD